MPIQRTSGPASHATRSTSEAKERAGRTRHVAAPVVNRRSRSPSADDSGRVRSPLVPPADGSDHFTPLPLDLKVAIVDLIEKDGITAPYALSQASLHFRHILSSGLTMHEPRKVGAVMRAFQGVEPEGMGAVIRELHPPARAAVLRWLPPEHIDAVVDEAVAQEGGTHFAHDLLCEGTPLDVARRTRLLVKIRSMPTLMMGTVLARQADLLTPGELSALIEGALLPGIFPQLDTVLSLAAGMSRCGIPVDALFRALAAHRDCDTVLTELCEELDGMDDAVVEAVARIPDLRVPELAQICARASRLGAVVPDGADASPLHQLLTTVLDRERDETSCDLLASIAVDVALGRRDDAATLAERRRLVDAVIDSGDAVVLAVVDAMRAEGDFSREPERRLLEAAATHLLQEGMPVTRLPLQALHHLDADLQVRVVREAVRRRPTMVGTVAMDGLYVQPGLVREARAILYAAAFDRDISGQGARFKALCGAVPYHDEPEQREIVRAALDPRLHVAIRGDMLCRLLPVLSGLKTQALQDEVLNAARARPWSEPARQATVEHLDALAPVARKVVVDDVLRAGIDCLSERAEKALGRHLGLVQTEQRDDLMRQALANKVQGDDVRRRRLLALAPAMTQMTILQSDELVHRVRGKGTPAERLSGLATLLTMQWAPRAAGHTSSTEGFDAATAAGVQA